jgi:pimeloyl-ACP methyl ester carboxylesterase
MYYEIYGNGEPLLIIHGNGGSVFSAKDQIPFFQNKYKVIVVDSRGHGKTNNNIDSLTYDLIADDINSLLEHLKIDSAHVFGQSDGAIVGLIMAFRYPKKVKKLAAMAPNTRPDSAVTYPEVENWLKRNIALKMGTDSNQNGEPPVLVMSGRLSLSHIIEMKSRMRLMQYHPHISKEAAGSK